MRHETITLKDARIIGMYKDIPFSQPEACARFWGEYVEKIVKPVFIEGKVPDDFQKAALENNVGEFGLCVCNLPNHNCATCVTENFTKCNRYTFTYVIGGLYKGGDVPECMRLFPIHSGRWLKVFFEGGMKAFQEQFAKFHKEWLPLHPEYKWAKNSSCMEWYQGTDINSPDYQCGVMLPIDA